MKTNKYLLMLMAFSISLTLKLNAQRCTYIAVNATSSVICAGGSSTLTASGINGTQYNWSTGATGNVLTVSPSVTTTYSVTGKKGSCTDTKTITIKVNSQPTVTINSGGVCFGQSFTLTPSGAENYTFSCGSPVTTPFADCCYTVTGSNEGCSDHSTAISKVTVFPLPKITVNSGTICAGESFTIIPSGASTYSFSSGSAVVTPTCATSYSVIGKSSDGCLSEFPAIAHVKINDVPVILVNSGSICQGESFTMTPTGAVTYTFSSGSQVVSPTVSTTYSVMGTSAEGCMSKFPGLSNVKVKASPVISVNNGTICAGESFTMIPTGANSYTFSSGSAIVNPSATTSYSVTGTGANGCVSLTNAVSNVIVNTLPTVNAGADQTIYAGYGSVSCATLTGTASGPTGPYQYSWSNGDTTLSTVVCPSVTTSYTLNVTAGSCSGSDELTVNVIDVSCDGNKVMVCHNGHTICIASPAVAAHLAHGCSVGPCTSSFKQGRENTDGEISFYPNPNNGDFVVEIPKQKLAGPVKIEVLNPIGQVIYTYISRDPDLSRANIEIDKSVPAGIYLLQVSTGTEKSFSKILLTR